MNRAKGIVRASIIGIIANVVLSALKLVVGLIAGSIAIILDAVNNLTDIFSSVVTIVGTKFAARRPDSGHPYGHGRSEYIAALMVGLIIFMTGVMSLLEAVPKVITPKLADYSWATITVVVLAIIVKLILGVYVRRMGRKLDSSSLSASGMDALFDAVLSFATLIGIIATMLFQISIDGILGVIIALFILRTSLEIVVEASGDIMGRTADHAFMRKIQQQIATFPQVDDVYDLMLHNYGPTDLIGSVQIQVPDTLTAREIHQLSQRIIRRIFTRYGVMLTVGIYAENVDQPEKQDMKATLLEIIQHFPEVHQMHGFYVDDEENLVTFDLVVGDNFTDRMKRQIARRLRQRYPRYQCLIMIDFSAPV